MKKNIEDILDFIHKNFDETKVTINRFKENRVYVDIDCLSEENKELAIIISDESVGFSTIEKISVTFEDQFGLYNEFLRDFEQAKARLMEIKSKGIYVPPVK